jgi:hypothetical protein
MAQKHRTYEPTNEQCVGALNDVAYEIEQILDLRATWPAERGLRMNAWLESLLIHVRALLDFFEHASRTKVRGEELDDVLAKDYGCDAASIDLSDTFRMRLNKDLAHIAFSRQTRRGDLKLWTLSDIDPLLARGEAFARHIVATWGGLLSVDQNVRWRLLVQRLAPFGVAA